MQASCGQMHNFNLYKYLWRELLGVQLEAFLKKKIEKILQNNWMHKFWGCIQVGSKCMRSGAKWRISMKSKRRKFKWLVHPLLISHGLRYLIRCLKAQPKLMAFPIQLISECIIYIHIMRFKLLKWMTMMWHKALKNTSIHRNKLLFLIMEMKRRFMLHL